MSNRLPIPLAVFEQHSIVLGKTRSGKSSKMRVMIEAALDRQMPVGIIDPKGDWWGLKSSADGKKAGYPVVIFGGAHGDIPINAQSGNAVAELVATGNRPFIIDLKGWTVADRTRFFIGFAETFFAKTKGRRILAIDEVHNFAPQTSGRVDPQTGLMLHWANRLASEGSGLGITLISASQRPQKVHKDYVTSHETLIACRVIHKRDRQAYVDWIEACGDDKSGNDVLSTVANMKREDAWVWSPEIGFGPKRITWPLFSTYDSFKPQAAKSRRLKGWAAVNLDEVKDKFAVAIEEAKANNPKELRAEVAKLKAERAKLEAEKTRLEQQATTPTKAGKPDKDAIAMAEKRGEKAAFASASKTIKELQSALEAAMKVIVQISAKDFFKAGGDAVDKEAISKALKDAATRITQIVEKSMEVCNKDMDRVRLDAQRLSVRVKKLLEEDVTIKLSVKHNEPFTIVGGNPPARLPRPLNNGPVVVNGDLTPAKQRILDAIAWVASLGNPSVPKDTIAFMADTTPNSSAYSNNLGSLRTAGLIEYPSGGMLALTEEGNALANQPDAAPTHEAIMSKIADKLAPAQMRIMNAAVDVYPADLTKEELAERAGTTASSSAYSNNLGRLRTFGLLTYPSGGRVRADDRLFPMGKAA